MAKTDSEQWAAVLGAVPDDVHACSGAFRCTRAGTDQYRVRGSDVTGQHHVIAPHDALSTQLRQILHEVVHKTVVIIDHEDAHAS